MMMNAAVDDWPSMPNQLSENPPIKKWIGIPNFTFQLCIFLPSSLARSLIPPLTVRPFWFFPPLHIVAMELYVLSNKLSVLFLCFFFFAIIFYSNSLFFSFWKISTMLFLNLITVLAILFFNYSYFQFLTVTLPVKSVDTPSHAISFFKFYSFLGRSKLKTSNI